MGGSVPRKRMGKTERCKAKEKSGKWIESDLGFLSTARPPEKAGGR